MKDFIHSEGTTPDTSETTIFTDGRKKSMIAGTEGKNTENSIQLLQPDSAKEQEFFEGVLNEFRGTHL